MKRLAIVSLWCALLMLALAGAGTALYAGYALKPPAAGGTVRITIPLGYGSGQIAKLLEQNGLIRDATVFRYYLIYKKEGSRFQAGEYEMKRGMSIDDIIAMLNEGNTVPEETIRLLVPEGFTVEQIADKLAQLPGMGREEFLALVRDKQSFAALPWVSDIPDDSRLKYPLEGYLFPETYELKQGSTTMDAAMRMVNELERKLATLPPDWTSRLKESGLSFHQMLTVASLIEREAVLDEERPLVASVIYNRLKAGMRLQIDATVQYALDKPKERLYEKDLQVDSPYNTYRIDGLPPGPIASPSLKSIEAALYPADTKYLYYSAKNDGTQAHNFAETYEQHLKNVADMRKR